MFRPRSPEINTGQGPEWGEEAKDFYDYYGTCRSELLKNFKASNLEFLVGPKYKTYTSSGQEIESFTLFIQKKDSTAKDSKTFFIFSFAINGEFLGYRNMYLGNNLAQGSISTRFRGKGIASAIDLVTFDILQTEADKNNNGEKIAWRITNQNLIDLSDLNRISETEEFNNQALLEQKRVEQQRWQALYGSKGSLGASEGVEFNEYFREFEKKSEVIDFSNENSVELLKAGDKKLGIGKRIVSPYENNELAEKVKHRREEMLKKFVLDSSPEGSMVIDLRSEYE